MFIEGGGAGELNCDTMYISTYSGSVPNVCVRPMTYPPCSQKKSYRFSKSAKLIFYSKRRGFAKQFYSKSQ